MINFAETFQVTNAGGTVTLSPEVIPSSIYLEMNATRTILASNYAIEYSALPEVGTSWKVVVDNRLELNGNTFTVFGISYTADMEAASTKWVYTFDVVEVSGTPTLIVSISPIRLTSDDILQGTVLIDGTTPLAKLADGTSAYFIVCNVSGVPTYVAMSGGGTITNAGAFALAAGYITNSMVNASAGIVYSKMAALTALKLLTTDASGFPTTAGAGVITNADVNASAGIVYSKMAALTALKPVVTDASGIPTTTNQIPASYGGTGQDFSASTGFVNFSAGTASAGALTDMMPLQVSWETNYVGDFKILMPFAGTLTGIYGFLNKAVGASDAVITPKNQAGTTMTSGVITFTAADPKGTAQTSAPSANNTFAAGDILTFTTSGGSAAGVAQLSITFTRTALT